MTSDLPCINKLLTIQSNTLTGHYLKQMCIHWSSVIFTNVAWRTDPTTDVVSYRMLLMSFLPNVTCNELLLYHVISGRFPCRWGPSSLHQNLYWVTEALDNVLVSLQWQNMFALHSSWDSTKTITLSHPTQYFSILIPTGLSSVT